MNDRELLELAAKAVGFGAPDTGDTCWTESEYPRGSGEHGALWNYVGYMESAELWNPLTDDGDALRLAVDLGLFIDAYAPATTVGNVICPDSLACKTRMESHGRDPHAATRRAIVRAAAEIGKVMP